MGNALKIAEKSKEANSMDHNEYANYSWAEKALKRVTKEEFNGWVKQINSVYEGGENKDIQWKNSLN